jgi:hypothetical protein
MVIAQLQPQNEAVAIQTGTRFRENKSLAVLIPLEEKDSTALDGSKIHREKAASGFPHGPLSA